MGVAVDSSGNVYVTGGNNAFKIETPGTCSTTGTPCTITEIIDSTGDGGGNELFYTWGVATDSSGNVYVNGRDSYNTFKIETPGTCSTAGTPCTITEIIDATGDGAGNTLWGPEGVGVDSGGNVYVAGSSHNVFRLQPVFTPLSWVTVGDPGNAADDTGYGAVLYRYRISRYEVTNTQYAAFLNAVAATDTNGLYNTNMGSGYGGITRSGSPGSYVYSAIAGREFMPVNYVSFYDSLRFANWLHNGRPTGAQDSTTTEDGAYDMALGSSVVRKPGAQVFLPSEDEWYKAAYYAGSETYYDYPAGSNTQTTCATPSVTANIANCSIVVGDFTDVGSYTGAASPNGTFDQGGNAWEFNEAVSGSNRVRRGGSRNMGPNTLAASYRSSQNPSSGYADSGFRVASYLEPAGVPSLSPMGAALLGGLLFAIAVGGLAVQRRRA
jgi:hypothetical protein